MPDPDALGTALKRQVRDQFANTGSAYVTSPMHAAGADLQRMLTLAQAKPNERLLDVATGGGHVALAFAPRVAQVVAADLTPEMLREARTFIRGKGVDNVSFVAGDAEGLPLASASFAIITCRIAPHHFPHPERFVREAARVLVPGGRFVLIDSTVPPGPVGELFNRFEARRDPSHVRSLTDPEWVALLQQAGLLTLQATEQFPKRHEFASWAARSGVPEDERGALGRMLLTASPEVQTAYHVERQGDELIAFTDTKTLYLATNGSRRTGRKTTMR